MLRQLWDVYGLDEKADWDICITVLVMGFCWADFSLPFFPSHLGRFRNARTFFGWQLTASYA